MYTSSATYVLVHKVNYDDLYLLSLPYIRIVAIVFCTKSYYVSAVFHSKIGDLTGYGSQPHDVYPQE